jgi:hypothetical protein
MHEYMSKYWQLAVSANQNLKEDNDKGEVWIQKTVMLLWDVLMKKCGNIKMPFFTTPSWRLPDL